MVLGVLLCQIKILILNSFKLESIMKKVLLAILATGLVSAANATTATSTLTLNGTVVSSCASSLSAGTLNFTFVPGATPSAQSTNLTLACSVDSVISSLTATSANGWKFLGATHGALPAYTMTATSVSGTSPSNFNTTWSNAGSTSAYEETNSSITAGTSSIVVALQIAPAAISSGAPVDTYSDTVTFTTTF